MFSSFHRFILALYKFEQNVGCQLFNCSLKLCILRLLAFFVVCFVDELLRASTGASGQLVLGVLLLLKVHYVCIQHLHGCTCQKNITG